MRITATVLSALTALAFGILGVSAAIGGDSVFARSFGFAISSFDNGTMSGLEVVGCVVVAIASALNWFAVRAITTRPRLIG